MGTKVVLDPKIVDQLILDQSLAKQIGMTEEIRSKMLGGNITAIRFSTLKILCDLFDCDPGDLFKRVTD